MHEPEHKPFLVLVVNVTPLTSRGTKKNAWRKPYLYLSTISHDLATGNSTSHIGVSAVKWLHLDLTSSLFILSLPHHYRCLSIRTGRTGLLFLHSSLPAHFSLLASAIPSDAVKDANAMLREVAEQLSVSPCSAVAPNMCNIVNLNRDIKAARYPPRESHATG